MAQIYNYQSPGGVSLFAGQPHALSPRRQSRIFVLHSDVKRAVDKLHQAQLNGSSLVHIVHVSVRWVRALR